MKPILPLTEGTVQKGGQNEPNTSDKRPPAPKGSGGKRQARTKCSYCQSKEPCFDGKSLAGVPCQHPDADHWAKPFWAIQQLEEFPGEDREADCITMLNTMCEQEWFLCGRIIQPAGWGWWEEKRPAPIWKVQCFFKDECGEENAAWLPEGFRRVLLLPCMKNWPWFRRAS